MYDSLEGLHYKRGECSYYVSQILQDLHSSLEKKDLVYVGLDDLQVGDVHVQGFSSHLVTNPINHYPRISAKEQREDGKILIIPRQVLERKQRELGL